MSGLTFIAYYFDPSKPLAPYVKWNRSDHFVAPTWELARIEAGARSEGHEIVRLEISEPQRLLDPELNHTKMRDDDLLFGVTWEEAVCVAKAAKLATDLSAEEMRVFNNCIDSGFSHDWDEVVRTAFETATQERES